MKIQRKEPENRGRKHRREKVEKMETVAKARGKENLNLLVGRTRGPGPLLRTPDRRQSPEKVTAENHLQGKLTGGFALST